MATIGNGTLSTWERDNGPLAMAIFRAGAVPADRLEQALAEGAETGKPITGVLLDEGLVDPGELARLVAEHVGTQVLSLADLDPDEDVLRLLPADVARELRALPVGRKDGTPVVAIEDPGDPSAVEAVTASIGGNAFFAVARRDELEAAVERAYPADAATDASADAPAATLDDIDFGSQTLAEPAPVDEPDERAEAVDVAEPAHPEAESAVVSPEPDPQPAAELEPEPEPDPQPAAEPEVEPEPDFEPAAEAAPATVFDLVISLVDGRRIALLFDSEAAARAEASRIAEGAGTNQWPAVDGRAVRPDAIVSIDVETREVRRSAADEA